MAKIICGFSGVGKSYAADLNHRIVDLESSNFSWYEHFDGTKERNPNFPENYIDEVVRFMADTDIDYILLSCHAEVRAELRRRGIKYIIVTPMCEDKDEYLRRWLAREESDMNFIYSMDSRWHSMITSIYNDPAPIIYLGKNEYLYDIL